MGKPLKTAEFAEARVSGQLTLTLPPHSVVMLHLH
jgi:hypothetical protein